MGKNKKNKSKQPKTPTLKSTDITTLSIETSSETTEIISKYEKAFLEAYEAFAILEETASTKTIEELIVRLRIQEQRFQQSIERLYTTCNALQDKGKFHPGLGILILKFHYLLSNNHKRFNDEKAVIESLTTIVILLKEFMRHPSFTFGHDRLFIGMMHAVFKRLSGHFTTTNKVHEKSDLSNLKLLFYMKTPDSVEKLQALFNHWITPRPDGNFLIEQVTANDKQNFFSLARKVIKTLYDSLKNQPADLKTLCDLCLACSASYMFYSATHAITLYKKEDAVKDSLQLIARKNLSYADKKRHFAIRVEIFDTFLYPLSQFLKITLLVLRQNDSPDIQRYDKTIQSLFYQTIEFLGNIKFIYTDWEADWCEHGISNDLRYAVLGELIYITETARDLMRFLAPSLELSQPLEDEINQYKRTLAQLDKDNLLSKELAEKNAALLLEADTIAIKRLLSIPTQTPPPPPSQVVIDDTEKADDISDAEIEKEAPEKNLQTIFTEARGFLHTKSYQEAFNQFEKLYQLTKGTTDFIEQLCALEGQLFAQRQIISIISHRTYRLLIVRESGTRPFTPKQLDNLNELMLQLETLLKQFDSIHESYLHLTQHIELSKNQEADFHSNLEGSKSWVSQSVNSVYKNVNHLKDFLLKLNERMLLRRQQHIQLVGMDEFIRQGEENGHKKSRYTLERESITSLLKRSHILDANSRKIALTYAQKIAGEPPKKEKRKRFHFNTTGSVFLMKDGDLTAPLSIGIKGDPLQSMQADTIVALNVIFYIADGCKADQRTIDALNSFAEQISYKASQLAKLKTAACKHLLATDRKAYVTLLHEKNLLNKLFNISCKSNIDLALWKLEKLLGITKLPALGMFSQTAKMKTAIAALRWLDPACVRDTQTPAHASDDKSIAYQGLDLATVVGLRAAR